VQRGDFKKLIEEGWSLRKISLHYGFSRQTGSNLFKNIYGIKYREYQKKLKHEDVVKKCWINNVKEIFMLLEKEKPNFLHAIKKLYTICKGKNLAIELKLVNENIKGLWINNRKVLFREYVLRGNMPEEKMGFYRFKPPDKIYDILIVTLIDGKDYIYFIIPKHVLVRKKSVNLPLDEKSGSKYSVFRDNWNQMFFVI